METLSEKQYNYLSFLEDKLGYNVSNEITKNYLLNIYTLDFERVIDLFKNEIEIRRKCKVVKNNILQTTIKATEIENYTYCPVSFAIERTFTIPKPESAKNGEELHEQQNLVALFKKETSILSEDGFSFEPKEIRKKVSILDLLDESNKNFFEDIEQSKLIFPLKSDIENNSYFKNQNRTYVGKPDYIFKNNISNKVFVVEEKYQKGKTYTEDSHSTKFFENHLNQLRSYIYGLKELEIEYGYLVYWKYFGNPSYSAILKKCYVKRIEKNDWERRILVKYYQELTEVIKMQGGTFNPKMISANKCLNCVSSMLCGHKTGKFLEFKLPYSFDHFALKQIDFPDSLFNLKNIDYIDDLDSSRQLVCKIFKGNWWKFRQRFKTIISEEYNLESADSHWHINNKKIFLSRLSITLIHKENSKEEKCMLSLKDFTSQNELFADWYSSKITCFKRVKNEKGEDVFTRHYNKTLFSHNKVEITIVKGHVISIKEFDEILEFST